MNENTFKDWLDKNNINAESAAQLIGVEVQTIRHWRSRGVPERRTKHVEAVMDAYEKADPISARFSTQITIHPTMLQLQNWHNAAQAVGKDVETWTVNTLDAMAAETLKDEKKK